MKLFLITPLLFLYSYAFAQLPIDEEQHHKVVFNNNKIRVIDLTIAAGDTTLMHTHTANSVVIFLSNSELVIQNAGQAPTAAPVIPGATVYRNYGEKPVLHKVWVSNKNLFRCIVVEQLKIKTGHAAKLNWYGTKAIFNENWVTAYQLEIGTSKHTTFPSQSFLITYSGEIEVTSAGGKKKLHENEFIVCDKDEIKVTASTANAKLILLEFH